MLAGSPARGTNSLVLECRTWSSDYKRILALFVFFFFSSAGGLRRKFSFLAISRSNQEVCIFIPKGTLKYSVIMGIKTMMIHLRFFVFLCLNRSYINMVLLFSLPIFHAREIGWWDAREIEKSQKPFHSNWCFTGPLARKWNVGRYTWWWGKVGWSQGVGGSLETVLWVRSEQKGGLRGRNDVSWHRCADGR